MLISSGRRCGRRVEALLEVPDGKETNPAGDDLVGLESPLAKWHRLLEHDARVMICESQSMMMTGRGVQRLGLAPNTDATNLQSLPSWPEREEMLSVADVGLEK